MPFIKLKNGYKMYYIEKGKGPILVFIHGFLGSSWLFETQVEHFAQKGYRAIALDHLGHGQSDKPESETYELPDLTRYLDEVVAQLAGKEKIILIGHSMGGMIAQLYATTPDYVKRLRGLVLMSTAPKLRNPGLDKYVEDLNSGALSLKDDKAIRDIMVDLCFQRPYKKARPDIIEEFIKRTLQNAEYVGLRTMNSIVKHYDVESKIKAIKIPTLILTGDKDIFIPPPESDKMHELISNSKLVKFAPKIGHMIQYEALNDYHKALEDFF
ncbi:MAG: alpha/beta hydrolase, partial [Candidatus Helarchaeota archaeon]|nr:alpha/beta hydrolase [Candidatus Helarchaeota archaeon]